MFSRAFLDIVDQPLKVIEQLRRLFPVRQRESFGFKLVSDLHNLSDSFRR